MEEVEEHELGAASVAQFAALRVETDCLHGKNMTRLKTMKIMVVVMSTAICHAGNNAQPWKISPLHPSVYFAHEHP
jgi:hypothetical protein